MSTIGELRDEVTLDNERLRRGIDEATKAIDGFTEQCKPHEACGD